jgi:hypothetical protein
LKRQHWTSAGPIRTIFRGAREAVGLRYFNPHSLRDTLVHRGQTVCRTPEDFKAWCQNLGHEKVLTIFKSYGSVGTRRQGEIVREWANPRQPEPPDVGEIAKAVARRIPLTGRLPC